MHELSLFVLYFFAYAFLGWLTEFLYFLIFEHRVRLTNFLRLPFLPIYGIGALTIVLLIGPYVHNPFLVFALGVVAATVIEYVGHVLIEKIFHIELWNYDHKKFNFQGRVALDNSIGFGILALLLVYVIHPFVTQALQAVPAMVTMIVALVLAGLLLIDVANSVTSLTRLRLSTLKSTITDVQTTIVEQLAKLAPSPVKVRLRRTRTALLKLHRANLRRLQKAFPGIRFARRRKA